MKLVAVFAIEASNKQLKALFLQQKIGIFSEVDVKGFRLGGQAISPDNWFGGSGSPAFSVCYFAFLEAEKAADLLEAIRAYNADHPHDTNPFHAFQLNVEAAV